MKKKLVIFVAMTLFFHAAALAEVKTSARLLNGQAQDKFIPHPVPQSPASSCLSAGQSGTGGIPLQRSFIGSTFKALEK